VGCNLGFEEDGKGDDYIRPVVVLRKFNRNLFIGVPLSSAMKHGKYYYNFRFTNRDNIVLLSQIKAFDSRRLLKRMGWVRPDDFQNIKRLVAEMIVG